MDKKKLLTIGIIIVLYVLSTAISYFLFSQKSPAKTAVNSPVPTTTNGQIVFDTTLPKTESCPLNGELFSKPQKDWWEKHRPLGVMIENHENTRPQSGLSSADAVYEVVAEGGITRFLAIFYCQDAGIIGPVRSARTYFLDFISEYGGSPLYAHVGGANQPGPADALSQIESYGWGGYNDMNQFSIGFPTFYRDYNRLGRPTSTEHTMYSTTDKLWKFATDSRKLTNIDKENVSWDEGFVPYGFKDDGALDARIASQNLHLEFWSRDSNYFVDWKYERATNSYKRFSGKTAHIDLNNKKQLTAKNLVVLFMQESNANDGYENNQHLLYRTKGSGKAMVFQDGKKINATWRKDKRTSRTLLFDENGALLKFNRGVIWFSILPTDGIATVK